MNFYDIVAIFMIFFSINEMRNYKQSYVNLSNDLEYKKLNKFRIIEFFSNVFLIIACISVIYCNHFDKFSKIIISIGGISYLCTGLIVAYRNFKFFNKKDFPEYNSAALNSYKKYVTGKIKWLLIITVAMLLFLFARDYLNKIL